METQNCIILKNWKRERLDRPVDRPTDLQSNDKLFMLLGGIVNSFQWKKKRKKKNKKMDSFLMSFVFVVILLLTSR